MKKVYLFYQAMLGFFILGAVGFLGAVPDVAADQAEVEKYVRARIDIGESMVNFFRRRGGAPQFGPDGEGPSMEELRKLEEEINAEVARILARYDLTIKEYQERSPDVFENKKAVDQFLEDHPDLKKRYLALPPSPTRGRR